MAMGKDFELNICEQQQQKLCYKMDCAWDENAEEEATAHTIHSRPTVSKCIRQVKWQNAMNVLLIQLLFTAIQSDYAKCISK